MQNPQNDLPSCVMICAFVHSWPKREKERERERDRQREKERETERERDRERESEREREERERGYRAFLTPCDDHERS
jgi:hypothetical protein